MYYYEMPFQLQRPVSNLDDIKSFLSDASAARFDFVSKHAGAYITVDGSKDIDRSLKGLRWDLDTPNSGHIFLTTDRALTDTELEKLPFCLTDRTNNLMVEAHWKGYDIQIAWDKNELAEVTNENVTEVKTDLMLTDADLAGLSQDVELNL